MKIFTVATVLFTTYVAADVQCDISRKLANASNSFSFDLHSKLRKEGNVIYSPFSLLSALSMLYFGATNNTAVEIRKVLKYEEFGLSDKDIEAGFEKIINELQGTSDITKDFWRTQIPFENYTLHIANALLAQKCYEIAPEYSEKINRIFNAELKNVNFDQNGDDVITDVNSWVREKTKGKIEKLLDSVDPNTLMMLLNAVYFKGMWKIQFDPEHTTKELFYKNGGKESASTVSMMHARNADFRYADMKENDFRVIEMPYQSNTICMWILLPNKRDGLHHLEKQLTMDLIASVNSSLQSKEIYMTAVPKFKIEYNNELSKILTDMGMKTAFQNGNFSRINKRKGLSVTQLLHKAVIEVSEEGTEAAAVSGLAVGLSLPTEEIISFYVDHPFLFFIIDVKDGMILFTGRAADI